MPSFLVCSSGRVTVSRWCACDTFLTVPVASVPARLDGITGMEKGVLLLSNIGFTSIKFFILNLARI